MRIANSWLDDTGKHSREYGMVFELKHEDPKVLWYKMEFIIKETIEKDKKKTAALEKKKK